MKSHHLKTNWKWESDVQIITLQRAMHNHMLKKIC